MFRVYFLVSTAIFLLSCGSSTDSASTNSQSPASTSDAISPVPAAALPDNSTEAISIDETEGDTTQPSVVDEENAGSGSNQTDPYSAYTPTESPNGAYSYPDSGGGYGQSSENNNEDKGDLITVVTEENYIGLNNGGAHASFTRSTETYYTNEPPQRYPEEEGLEEYCSARRTDYSQSPLVTQSMRTHEWDSTVTIFTDSDAFYELDFEKFNVGDKVHVLLDGEPYQEIPRVPGTSNYRQDEFPISPGQLSVTLDVPLHVDVNFFDFPLIEEIGIEEPQSISDWAAGTAIVWNGSAEPDSVMTIRGDGNLSENQTHAISLWCVVKDDGHFQLPVEVVEFISGWPAPDEWEFEREIHRKVKVGNATYSVYTNWKASL